MAQKIFRVTVSRVDGALFDGEAVSLTVPGSEGEMTLLPDHMPIISVLKAGTVTVRKADGASETFIVDRGTLEVHGNHATVLL